MDLADPQQWNAYAYSYNSPITNSDPTGMRPECGGGTGNYECSSGVRMANPKANGNRRFPDTTSSNTEATPEEIAFHRNRAENERKRAEADRKQRECKASFWCRNAKNVGLVAGIAAGIAVGAVCTAGTYGAGVVGCAAIAGAVGGIVDSYVGNLLDAEDENGWEIAGDALLGGVLGAATAVVAAGVAGRVAGRVAGGGARRVTGGGAGGNDCNSFTPDTRVVMADGTTRAIKDVKVQDVVLATDPETGESIAKAVVATIVGAGSKNLVRITVDSDGEEGNATGEVIATDGHPFWVPELGEWRDATHLKPGQWLQTSAGTHVQIAAIKGWTQTAQVYNLTVADIHTYYVLAGQTPVLVHNTGPCKAALKKFPNLSHLEGADPEDVLNAIPDHWTVSPMKKAPPGGGIRFTNPNAPGQSIIYESGWPGHPDPVHRGPYLRVNDGAGYADRIPLAGNPEIMLREMRSQGLIQ